VLIEGLDRANALALFSQALKNFESMPRVAEELATSFGVAALSNVMNNLPAGLLAGNAAAAAHSPPWIRDSVLVGVGLGPNLSVSGSLATILWLIALRREGISIGALGFLKAGILVMPPALLLATLAIGIGGR
jgi:arsenical pump membrane protein